jgi:hypothetical protein
VLNAFFERDDIVTTPEEELYSILLINKGPMPIKGYVRSVI